MRGPAQDLRRIDLCFERPLEASYRVKASRTAAAVVDGIDRGELERHASAGPLTQLSGRCRVTAQVVVEPLAGEEPVSLRCVESMELTSVAEQTHELRRLLKGGRHVRSDWSDGEARSLLRGIIRGPRHRGKVTASHKKVPRLVAVLRRRFVG